ncbi:hypothetical protein [Aquimarina sp. SS2-1]|uniref:hypothetical protein n=1 Tax=Aquimarina besae TaxID=3342247 RepID=UPI00366AF15F
MDRFDHARAEIQLLCDDILNLDKNLTSREIRLIQQLKTCKLFLKVERYKIDQESGINYANEKINFLCPEIEEFLFVTENMYKEI